MARPPVSNPSTGKTIVSVPRFGRKETEAAIASAEAALPAWSAKTGKGTRRHPAEVVAADDAAPEGPGRHHDLGTGQPPVTEAAGEIAYAASFLEWFAEEAKRIDGDVLQKPKAGQRLLALKQPIGVTAAITPWNFPAAMITRKAGPALAAGCTMVLKPAQQTRRPRWPAVLAEEAGVPAGVFHVVTGSSREIGAALCESDAVRKLSFTGSTEVGRTLMEQCAPTIKKLSLELGGNAPFIVFDDADLDRAVDGILASKFRNAGQTCVCANRIYIQAGVYEEVTKRLVAKVEAMKVGDGFGEGVTQGR